MFLHLRSGSNLEEVKAGLAKVVLYERRAKIKYQDELLSAEKEARGKGLEVFNLTYPK